MTLMAHPDEDRFIRGLAASPEDEALRLVYADWLEENGHAARAKYLWREVAYYWQDREKTTKPEWSDIEGVDPVWKAIVSRAPFGVLVPGLTFTETDSPATAEEIRALEARWERPLPADYAAFLMLHNGGVPSRPYLLGDRESRALDPVRFFSTHSRDDRGRPCLLTNATDLACKAPRPYPGLKRALPVGVVTYHYTDGTSMGSYTYLAIAWKRRGVIITGVSDYDDGEVMELNEYEYPSFTRMLCDLSHESAFPVEPLP